MKLLHRQILHLAAGAAALPAVRSYSIISLLRMSAGIGLMTASGPSPKSPYLCPLPPAADIPSADAMSEKCQEPT